MSNTVIGILAHVDAGKTTLAEAILYRAGKLKKAGRVDHGDTLLDTHALERERGITIFASQAAFPLDGRTVTLLDTPGHVDFSAETERMLQVLDYAVLVISGTDGVQAHTHTLWRLLELYNIPTFLFVTKMDLARRSKPELLAELRHELSEGCTDFTGDSAARDELLAMCREDILERYMETGEVARDDTAALIRQRLAYPCYFGSGLRFEGIDELLKGISSFAQPAQYPAAFGAKVFKISHDPQGNRLTHMKVTGGTLRVRDPLSIAGKEEKVSQLRLYNGARFASAETAEAGSIIAVPGLEGTAGGMGLGYEASSADPVLEPVMSYRIVLPEGCDPAAFLPRLRQLEEEDPQLHVTWNAHQREIHVSLMGAVQTEILKSLIAERFGLDVAFDTGRVLYKETIESTEEGVGHYEPLRHYAEVHLLLEPLPAGSGLVFAAKCPPDTLDRSWQALVLTHLAEKQHLGVLIGAPLTDMRITLASGKAHLKHTEGGDFRQATYRAVRQGLMQAKSVILEPMTSFRLEVPLQMMGRAITDIRTRSGEYGEPETSGSMAILRGTAPVTTMNDYAMEVASYTGGRGRLLCQPAGYGRCHDPEAVIAAHAYDPEADLENTPDSVFCAHGGGFAVKWNDVPRYMHLDSILARHGGSFQTGHRNMHLDDKELEAIMEREFGPIRRPQYRSAASASVPDSRAAGEIRPKYLIVDGYNVIFAWKDLKELASRELSAARDRLLDICADYAAYTKCEMVVVFDGYKVPGNPGEQGDFHGIRVVYTKENETGDMYIEKLIARRGANRQVRVVTSDGMLQVSTLRSGVLRMPASEFEKEVDAVSSEIRDFLQTLRREKLGSVAENVLAQRREQGRT